MRKKIIFCLTVCLFSALLLFSFNISQQNNTKDISLMNIAVMSQANAEGGTDNPCIDYGSGCYNKVWYAAQKDKLW